MPRVFVEELGETIRFPEGTPPEEMEAVIAAHIEKRRLASPEAMQSLGLRTPLERFLHQLNVASLPLASEEVKSYGERIRQAAAEQAAEAERDRLALSLAPLHESELGARALNELVELLRKPKYQAGAQALRAASEVAKKTLATSPEEVPAGLLRQYGFEEAVPRSTGERIISAIGESVDPTDLLFAAAGMALGGPLGTALLGGGSIGALAKAASRIVPGAAARKAVQKVLENVGRFGLLSAEQLGVGSLAGIGSEFGGILGGLAAGLLPPAAIAALKPAVRGITGAAASRKAMQEVPKEPQVEPELKIEPATQEVVSVERILPEFTPPEQRGSARGAILETTPEAQGETRLVPAYPATEDLPLEAQNIIINKPPFLRTAEEVGLLNSLGVPPDRFQPSLARKPWNPDDLEVEVKKGQLSLFDFAERIKAHQPVLDELTVEPQARGSIKDLEPVVERPPEERTPRQTAELALHHIDPRTSDPVDLYPPKQEELAGAIAESVSPPAEWIHGSPTKVLVPQGEIPAMYALTSVNSLIPSHQARAGFLVNPDYPFTNERPYHLSRSLQQATLFRAGTLNPQYIVNTSPTPVDGPPIVDSKGVVYGGNGRVMAVQLAEGQRIEALREAIIENAEAFGLNKSDVDEWIKAHPNDVPIVVRVINPTPGQETKLSRVFNQTAAAGFTETQLGASASRIMSNMTRMLLIDAVRNYETLNAALSEHHGVEILKSLVSDGIVPPAQAGGMVAPNGRLTPAAKELIRKTVLGAAVDDPETVLAVEVVAPGFLNKFESISPYLVALPDEYKFTDILDDALRLIVDAKSRGLKPAAVFYQARLFGDNDERRMITLSLAETLLSAGPRRLKSMLEEYRKAAELFAHPTLGFIRRESREEVLARIFVGAGGRGPDVVREDDILSILFGKEASDIPPPTVRLEKIESLETVPVISEPDDIVNIADQLLGREPVETVLLVVVDKDSRVLGVIRHSIGIADHAPIHVAHLLGAIADVPGAAGFYLVHNHPSGKATPSQADRLLIRNLYELTRDTPIELKGGVVYAYGTPYGTFINPAEDFKQKLIMRGLPEVTQSVPLYVRRFDRRVGFVPNEAIEDYHSRVGQGRSGAILLDFRDRPVAFVPLDVRTAKKLRPGGSTELLHAIHTHNAKGVVVVAGQDWDEAAIKNVASFMDRLGTRFDYEIVDSRTYSTIDVPDPQPTFYANPMFNPAVIREAVRELKGFWEDKIGEPLWQSARRQAGTLVTAGISAATVGNLTDDSDLTPEQRIGVIILSALAAAGAAKGALKLGIGDKFGSWFIPNYKLPAKYLELYHDYRSLKETIAREFVEAGRELGKQVRDPEALSALGKIWIGDAPSNEEAEALLKVPREVVKRWTRHLVDLGLLSERTWLKNIDTYVKRSYLIHDATARLPNTPLVKAITTIATEFMMRGTVKVVPKSELPRYIRHGWEVVGKVGKDRVKVRMDYSPEMREAMGEITNAVYSLLRTGEIISNDVATYRFYEWIAKEFGSAEPREGYVQVRGGIKPGTNVPRFGALEGLWIPKPIYDDLQNMVVARYVKQMPGVRHYLKLNAAWKASKTIWNPVVHMNNFMSNVHLYYLRDGNFALLAKAAKELKKEYKNPGSSLLSQAGLMSDYVTQELKDLKEHELKRILDTFSNLDFPNHVARGLQLVRGFARAPANLYQLEDLIFRAGMYLTKLSEGWEPRAAAMYAKQSFVDYDIRAPAINFLRALPLPFIGWTVGAVPVLVESAIKRPWKYATLAAFWWGIHKLGSAGEKESTLLYEEGAMPERYGGSIFGIPILPPRAVRLPGVSIEGHPVRLELTRWWPGADVVEAGYGKMAIPSLPQPLQPTWGALGSIINTLQGIDTYTGRKAPGFSADPWGHMLRIGAREFLPPLAPGGFHFSRIMQAARGVRQTSAYAEPYTLLQAALAATGIRLHQMDKTGLLGVKLGEVRRQIKDIDEEALETKRLALTGYMPVNEALDKLKALQQQKQKITLRFLKQIQPALEAQKEERAGGRQ
ncbi:MAG: JAB domain-containing protein [Candidatus Caldarchaeum sp.]